MGNGIWITWQKQVRNRSMSSKLDVKLHEIIYSGPRVIRYFVCMWRTLRILVSEQPQVVFAQNPSIVLVVFVSILKRVFEYKFAIDAHYFGVIAPNRNAIFQKTLDLCNRFADVVIITNESHASYIRALGGTPFVCQDPLPDLSRFNETVYRTEGNNERKVLFVCSFDIDEPFHEAFEAAHILQPEGFRFIVSGKYSKANILPHKFPHVKFLGYVSDEEFYHHMLTAEVVLDLTTNDDCLVCGAYEAMSAERPLVTSDTAALKGYFFKGTIFTKHEPAAIANAIREAFKLRHMLIAGIRDWKARAVIENNDKIRRLRRCVGLEEIMT